MSDKYLFELIAIQKEEKSISSSRAMIYLLSANNHICDGKEVVNTDAEEVKLSNGTIVKVKSIMSSAAPLNDCYSGIFQVQICGKFDNVEPLRVTFIKYLLQNKFTVFIVNDEISKKMTTDLYPCYQTGYLSVTWTR